MYTMRFVEAAEGQHETEGDTGLVLQCVTGITKGSQPLSVGFVRGLGG